MNTRRATIWALGGAAALAAAAAAEDVSLNTYYPSPLGVYTNMTVSSSAYLARDGGNVGIGTYNPAALLDVAGQAHVQTLVINRTGASGAQPFLDFYTNGSYLADVSAFQESANHGGLRIFTNSGGTGLERVRVTSAGLVGIGTASPRGPLDVPNGVWAGWISFPTIRNGVPGTGSTTFGYIEQWYPGNFVNGSGVHDGYELAIINQPGDSNPENEVWIGNHGAAVVGHIQLVAQNVIVGGNLDVVGTLTKGAGAFMIDHPLDPEHKVLRHSFVESPDMKNVYDGTAVLDSKGEATIELPAYFEALNRDYRYQVTPLGRWAGLYVKQEVAKGRFVVASQAGEKDAGLKFSWQVTGIRQDAYAKEHPIVVEEAKGPEQAKRTFPLAPPIPTSR